MKKIILSALTILVLNACMPSNQSYVTTGQNTAIGAAMGAGLGNLVGKDSEATATGAVIGAIVGSQYQTGNWGLGGNAPQSYAPQSQPYHPQTQPNYPSNGYNQGYVNPNNNYTPYRPRP